MNRAVLAADIGTSSLKVALITEAGSICAYERVRFSPLVPFQWRWLESFKSAVASIRKHCSADDWAMLHSIVVSGNGPTVVPVSEKSFSNPFNNEELIEPLWWNDDISAEFPFSATAGGSLFIPRLQWLKHNQALRWDGAHFVFSGPEYMLWQLSGEAVTILPERRFDFAYWNDTSLLGAGLESEKLPPFVFSGTRIGSIRPSLADELCVPHSLALCAGAPDFVAALIGTNVLSPHTACDRAGTSEGINVCAEHGVYAEGIRVLPSVIQGLYNAGVLLGETGKLFSDFKKRSVFASLAYDDCVRVLLGKKITHKKYPHSALVEGSLLMEAIALRVKTALEKLQVAGYVFSELRVCGGQAHNDMWNQYKSSLTGVPITIMQLADAELLGDAVLGFYGMGVFSSINEGANTLVRVTKRFEP